MNGKHNAPNGYPSGVSHDEARALLQKSLEARLNAQERAALDAHLGACAPCQAYNRNLGRLHNRLAQALPARWAHTAPVDHSATRNFQNIEGRIRRKRMQQRFLAAAQPVLWAGGVAVLAMVMVGLLTTLRPAIFSPESPTSTSAETQVGIIPSSVGASSQEALPCTAQTVVDATVYSGASVQSQPLGTLPLGAVVQVHEIHYIGGQEAPWLKIDYQGRPGWLNAMDVVASGDCGLIPSVIMTATPLIAERTATDEPSDPRATQTPSLPSSPMVTPTQPQAMTATATPELPPDTCRVAPTDTPGVDTNIYASPAKNARVIGSLRIGEYVPATGVYAPTNYSMWVRISINGQQGWIEALYYMFQGEGCWPLPNVDVPNPPPTWTVVPYTPQPTSTLPPEADYNRIIYLDASIGTSDQLTAQLPNDAGSTTEHVGIRVSVPPGEVRMITILVECTGADSDALRWGIYGSEPRYECGRSIGSGVSQGGNLIMITLAAPSDGITTITYTVIATVNSAP